MKNLIRYPRSARHERPFMVIWEVTQACDLACRHCRASAQPMHHPNALTTAEGKRLLEDVRSFGKPSPIFVFTGGDPFKRADLTELISYAREIGVVPAVSPSATPLLNAENLTAIRQAGAKAISLSLDASTAREHDAFRGVDGSYDWTLKGWKQAEELGLKVQVNSTVTRHNLQDLGRLAGLIAQLGAMTWSVFFLVPTGRAKKERDLEPEECEAVMHFLADVSRYISVKTTEGHHFKRVLLQRAIWEEKSVDFRVGLHPLYQQLRRQFQEIVERLQLRDRVKVLRPPMNINAANGFVFVSHLGDVFGSGFLPVRAGNVRERSLVDIYRDSPLFQELRDVEKLKGRCGRCEFRALCAGSRSRAFALTGDVHGEDPYCAYQPGSFEYTDDIAEKLLAGVG